VEPIPLSQVLEEEYASLGRGIRPGPGPAPHDERSRLRDIRRQIHGGCDADDSASHLGQGAERQPLAV
jgi:hypothetical protein